MISNPMPRSALRGKLKWDGVMSVPCDPAVNDLAFKTSFGETVHRTRLIQHRACHAPVRVLAPGAASGFEAGAGRRCPVLPAIAPKMADSGVRRKEAREENLNYAAHRLASTPSRA
jgi:hypothetical protein